MSSSVSFYLQTVGLGIEDDCPVCGYSWPGCNGLCIAHEAANGQPGPFHDDYNDDCKLCEASHD
jgi:hypothetical protein